MSVRCWASAGRTAAPKPAERMPAVVRPMSSLRLFIRTADLLPLPGSALTLSGATDESTRNAVRARSAGAMKGAGRGVDMSGSSSAPRAEA